jgi:dihydrodipicolinate reductase
MTNVAICGANGKMGKTIYSCISIGIVIQIFKGKEK